MMNSPLVTVIIPAYNHVRYLKEAIHSVLGQTYDHYELLILDDHSNDGTPDVVKEFNDPRMKFFRHNCNIGFVANWTYGVKLALGKYISILSDDDKYKPDFLIKRVSAFRDRHGLVAATGAFECCDDAGAFLRRSRSPSKTEKVYRGKELLAFTLGMTGEWFNGATLYDLEIVRSVWPYAMMAGTALDFSLHIRLSLLPEASVYFSADTDMVLRVHSDQESQRNSLYLAECAAKLAIQMWKFELKAQRAETRALFRKRLSRDLDHYAQLLWDRSDLDDARNMLLNKLSMRPTSVMTWVRLIRSYIARSKRPVLDSRV